MRLPDYWPGWTDIGAALRTPRCVVLASLFVFVATVLIQTLGIIGKPLEVSSASATATPYEHGTLVTYHITGMAHRDVLVDSARSVRCDGREEDVIGMTRNLVKAGTKEFSRSLYLDHALGKDCSLRFTLFWQPDFSIVYQSALDLDIPIEVDK